MNGLHVDTEQIGKIKKNVKRGVIVSIGLLAFTLLDDISESDFPEEPSAPGKQRQPYSETIYNKLKPIEMRSDYVEAVSARGVDCEQSYPHTHTEKDVYRVDSTERPMHIGGRLVGGGLDPDYFVLGEEADRPFDGYYSFAHGWVIRYDREVDLYWVYKFDDTYMRSVKTSPGETEVAWHMTAHPISFFDREQVREGVSYTDGLTTIYVGHDGKDGVEDWPLTFTVACAKEI